MTNVPEEVKDLYLHTLDGTGENILKGVYAGSRRGRAFGLAYRSWLEFTTNQAASPVYAGKKE